MKPILFLFLMFLFCYTLKAQTNTTIYYTAVDMPTHLNSSYWGMFDIKLLAEDLADLLQEATGKKFKIKPYENKKEERKGIFLILDKKNIYEGNEQGQFESNGTDYIKFKAPYATGISYAMYSWLEELGFHFYLPGNEWKIIPSINSVYDKKGLSKLYKPYFKNRIFGGNGGVIKIKGLDENLQNEKDWKLWYRRNRMGSDYLNIDGHAGEAFNDTYKDLIEKDPSILAPVNGKRQYNINAKLDPTNKKGISLFSNWVIEQAKRNKKVEPAFLPTKKYYSADAGDGYDYCSTPECLKQFKSVSDQSFSIVNETARKMSLSLPTAGISTYAYTQRADTPSFAIEKNVHVQVVAAAFQNTSTQAGLMLRWAAKIKNITQYDYLNITVWKADHPFFNLNQYHSYLQFLKTLNIEGMNYETSNSKFASGIVQYFILQYLNAPYLSINTMLDEFCKNNFGKAAKPIKNLLQEWYFSNVHLETFYDFPTFFADELGRFIQYLQEASQTPGIKPAEIKRLNELKAYVVFLCKMYELRTEHDNQKKFFLNPMQKIEKEKEILNYTWQFYASKIFHNTQLNNILTANMKEEEKASWNYYTGDFKKFKNGNPSALAELEFKKMAEVYLPMTYPLMNISDSFLKAASVYSADSIKFSTLDEMAVPGLISPFEFYCAAPGILKIGYQTSKALKPSLQKGKIAMVAVEKNDYSYLKYNDIYNENSMDTITFLLPTTGRYLLYLGRFDATPVDYVIYPGKNLFYHNKKSIPMDMWLMQHQKEKNGYSNKNIAMYVPAVNDLKLSYRYWDCINTLGFTSASGNPLFVDPKNKSSQIKVPLRKDQQKNFIFYSNTQFRWPPVLINTAPCYFFLKYPIKQ
jgi:Domain of unknown function (DUF4838)